MSDDLKPLYTWTGAVLDSDLHPDARLIALTLAQHMSNRQPVAWPSVPTLVRETGLSESTVYRRLKELIGDGWLVKSKRRTNNGQTGNTYQAATPVSGTGLSVGEKTPVSVTGEVSPEVPSITFPTGTAKPVERDPTKAELIAEKHLKPVVEAVTSKSAFDLVSLIREAWGPAWREAADGGIDPVAVGVLIAGFYFQYVTDEAPNWGRIGQLVKRYGRVAIFGLDEAMGHADDPYRYAFRRCQQAAADRAAVERNIAQGRG